jgi:hypothetical protein
VGIPIKWITIVIAVGEQQLIMLEFDPVQVIVPLPGLRVTAGLRAEVRQDPHAKGNRVTVA